MPTTNYPTGVSSFGIPLFGQGSLYDMASKEVYFVCNRAGVVNGNGLSRDTPLASLADAAKLIPTGTGIASGAAMVYVLSGHAENVTGADLYSGSSTNAATASVFPAGTRIIGEGFNLNRPTLTFTAAASTIDFSNANCSIENIIMQGPQTGTTTVAAFVTVTAAGCMVRQNLHLMATSATALVTTAISLSSAAADFWALDNTATAVTGTPTSWLSSTGTTGPNRTVAQRNVIMLPLSATTSGCIDFSAASGTAPTNSIVTDNTLINLTASATVDIKGAAGWTGIVAYNNLGGGVTTAMTTTAINTPASVISVQNFVTSGGKWAIVGGGTAAQTS